MTQGELGRSQMKRERRDQSTSSSEVSAVRAEEEAAEADPTPESSLTNTEDRGHRDRGVFT